MTRVWHNATEFFGIPAGFRGVSLIRVSFDTLSGAGGTELTQLQLSGSSSDVVRMVIQFRRQSAGIREDDISDL